VNKNKKKDETLSQRWSLWRELYTAQTLIVAMLLESLNYANLTEHLNQLSSVCADSKRQRQLQHIFLNTS